MAWTIETSLEQLTDDRTYDRTMMCKVRKTWPVTIGHVTRITKTMSTNATSTTSILIITKHVVLPLFPLKSLNRNRSFFIKSKLPSSFSCIASTTLLSLTNDSEKWVALRRSCVAINASCSESSSCSAREFWRMVGVAVILEVAEDGAGRIGGTEGKDGMRSSTLGTLGVVSSVGMSVASTGMVSRSAAFVTGTRIDGRIGVGLLSGGAAFCSTSVTNAST